MTNTPSPKPSTPQRLGGGTTTAVIMAAGLGSRFGSMTETMPKGFIEVGGKAMVIRSIETLIECGIKRIIIGTGYHREWYERLAEQYPQVETVFSPRYAETNSMYTLYNSREAIGDDDFLLRIADLHHVGALAAEVYGELRMQFYQCHQRLRQTVGIGVLRHKLSSAFYKTMCSEYAKIVDEKPKLGYEYQLLWMSQNVSPVFVLNAKDVAWYEIDDADDLAYAEENIVNKL